MVNIILMYVIIMCYIVRSLLGVETSLGGTAGDAQTLSDIIIKSK